MTTRGSEIARIMQESALYLQGEWAHRLGGQALERLRQELAELVDIARDSENPRPAL
jgi:hypothetical protein